MLNQRVNPSTLAVILGGGRGTRLYPLTKMRAKPAVPLGGKYRLIDVPISNCLHSGLNKIYVLTQFESHSLHQHVQGTYVFDRFGGGFVEILAAQQRLEEDSWYQGTSDAVRQNLVHFGENKWDELLILSGDQLYHMDFTQLLAHHRRTKADITLAVLPVDSDAAESLGIMQVNDSGEVIHFHEKPKKAEQKGLETSPELFKSFGVEEGDRPYLASMGIYVFNGPMLFEELREQKHVDFGKNMFPAALGRLSIQTYIFDGYWEDIGTVKSFHEANLNLAKSKTDFSFNTPNGLIYTRPRTLPGTITDKIVCEDSIIGDGCVVKEATLKNTVLGLRSQVGSNVKLTRTLVMGADFYESDADKEMNARMGRPNLGIGDNVVIENAIVDKNVRIGNDVIIKNPDKITDDTDDICVRDGVICILKGATIPSGARYGV